MKSSDSSNSYAPHIALLLVQLFFGSLPVVGKIILKVIPPFGLVGFRIGITALVLFVFQKYRGDLRLEKKGDYLRFFILSFFGISINQIFFISGLALTKASNSSILAVTIPIFALTFASVFGIEKLRPLKIAGIVIAAVGVILLIDPRKASFSSETTLGDLLIVCNSLFYGIYVVTSKEIVTRNGAIKSTAWLFIFASLVSVPLGIYSLSAIEFSQIAPVIWLLILYISIVSTALPYLFNAWALARVNPSIVASYVYLQPIIGFIFAVIFLNEEVSAITIFAALLIFVGVYLATKRRIVRETTDL